MSLKTSFLEPEHKTTAESQRTWQNNVKQALAQGLFIRVRGVPARGISSLGAMWGEGAWPPLENRPVEPGTSAGPNRP